MTHPVRAWARRHGDGRERGAAAVEFALILPVLLLIVFGIINFGFMLSARQAVSQAAAEGARAAAVTTGDEAAKDTAGTTAMQSALATQGETCAGNTCDVTFVDCDGERCAEAEVRIPYDWLIPMPFDAPTLNYTASARVS